MIVEFDVKDLKELGEKELDKLAKKQLKEMYEGDFRKAIIECDYDEERQKVIYRVIN